MNNSMFELIVSQGRIADRASGMITGARLTAEAIEKSYNTNGIYLGISSPAENDRWPESLEKARPTLDLLKSNISEKLNKDRPIVLVSNTCSASLATLPEVSEKHPNVVIVWIDAHGDFNTPSTSESGYLGGMVLSGACGIWDSGYGSSLNPSQILILGARDIDTSENALLEEHGVTVLPPNRCNIDSIIDFIDNRPVWIHIDWDVLEPGYLPADYVVPEGLSPKEIRALLEVISSEKVLGIELAEFNSTDNDLENDKAIRTILDMVYPILEKFSGK